MTESTNPEYRIEEDDVQGHLKKPALDTEPGPSENRIDDGSRLRARVDEDDVEGHRKF